MPDSRVPRLAGWRAVGFGNHAEPSMNMKTLEELDAEIAATEAAERQLYEQVKATEDVYNAARSAWIKPYNELQELKRRRAVLAELLETYRGQDKLAV